jgi:hypothetical protein
MKESCCAAGCKPGPQPAAPSAALAGRVRSAPTAWPVRPTLPRCPACALALPPGWSAACAAAEPGPRPLTAAWPASTTPIPGRTWRQYKFQREAGLGPASLAQMLADARDWTPRSAGTADLLAAGAAEPGSGCASAATTRPGNWSALRRLEAGACPRMPDLLQRRPRPDASIHAARAAHRQCHAGLLQRRPRHAGRLRDRRVLLVDDVMTTGATLQSAARAAGQAGAAEVSALVFARTPAPTLEMNHVQHRSGSTRNPAQHRQRHPAVRQHRLPAAPGRAAGVFDGRQALRAPGWTTTSTPRCTATPTGTPSCSRCQPDPQRLFAMTTRGLAPGARGGLPARRLAGVRLRNRRAWRPSCASRSRPRSA